MADPVDLNDFQHKLVPHCNFNLIKGIHDPDEIDKIKSWAIRDSDIFAITYPKSGTIWMQQILRLIAAKGDVTAISHEPNAMRVPWIELIGSGEQFESASSPRLRVSHLHSKFMPLGLTQKGKVIYVTRNPKDVLVSYYHFHKIATMLETPKDFNDFFEKFLKGNVYGNCWFDHIKTWYSEKDKMKIIFVKYEDMIEDLSSVVARICKFLGTELSDEQLSSVVDHSIFNNMKQDSKANYKLVPDSLLSHKQGSFMRKGTIGDWKNYFTVAQNERFDQVFKEKMKDFHLSFVWDISDMEV